jgi:N-dimethylarginine dimethylaminohydrolase
MTPEHRPARDVLLVSPPRRDWRVHGAANVFSQAVTRDAATTDVAAGTAFREWFRLVVALMDAGAHVVVLPATDDDASLTGMPYTAEAGFVGRGDDGEPLWLLPTMKPPHRRGERAHIERWAAACHVQTREVAPTWEGQGDVLVVDGAANTPRRFVCTAGLGPQARTAPEAYDAIAGALPGPSLALHFHADPWFHGNTFLGFFSSWRGTNQASTETIALVCEAALLPQESDRLRAFLPDVTFVPISREDSLCYPTNALQVGRRVLAPPGVPPHVRGVWQSLGLDVVEVALPTLFGRGGGAAVCMTNRLDLDLARVPAHLHASAWLDRWRELAAEPVSPSAQTSL